MKKDILLFLKNLDAGIQEITANGGKVALQLTEKVVIAHFKPDFDVSSLKMCSETAPSRLDKTSKLAAAAWQQYQNKGNDRAPSSSEGKSWASVGFMPPEKVKDDEPVDRSTGTPTSRYMVGSIAVGVVIVSGNTPALTLTVAEQQLVVSEVLEALNFLSGVEPRAELTFSLDIRVLNVAVAPGSTASYEEAEGPWRNAATAALGFAGDRSGSTAYVNSLRTSRNTNWAYVGYFTKYPLKHFAYAIEEKLVMHYGNDGWGSNQINRVFAHESCHIFGAADEYGDCACGGAHGQLGVPNNNCVKCAPHVPCLMEANVLEICNWTRGQIGWDERLYPWHSWENLGGLSTDAPAVAAWGNNRLDTFVRGTNNHLFHKWWDGTRWSGWEDLGGIISSAPAVAAWGPNRLDVFARGLEHQMWHKWWDGTRWSDWEDLGGILTSAPAVAAWGNNRLDCFVRGINNHMWHKWWDGTRWSGWEDLGGTLMYAPAVAAWGNNRLDTFVTGTDGAMWHKWWDGTRWSGWESLGGILIQAPAATSWGNNRLDCFGIGTNRHMFHKWWDGSRWSAWYDLGGELLSAPAAASWGANRLDAFALGKDFNMWHLWNNEGVIVK
jgi:hypothetical protein